MSVARRACVRHSINTLPEYRVAHGPRIAERCTRRSNEYGLTHARGRNPSPDRVPVHVAKVSELCELAARGDEPGGVAARLAVTGTCAGARRAAESAPSRGRSRLWALASSGNRRGAGPCAGCWRETCNRFRARGSDVDAVDRSPAV